MSWTRIRRVVLAGTAVAALALLAGGVTFSWLRPRPEIIVVPPPAAQPDTAPKAGFAFTPLDQPKPLPALRFVDGDGRTRGLADFAGKTVLLNIWATWCGPCREEMPALDRLQARLGGPAFEVVALSIDRKGLPAVRAFYEELGIGSLHPYVDESARAASKLDATGLPTTLLVDPQGREIGRVVGPADWDSPEVSATIQRYREKSPEAARQPQAGSDEG